MGVLKNQYIGGLPKKGGGLGQFVDLRGGAWQERGGGVFEGGGLIPQCPLCTPCKAERPPQDMELQKKTRSTKRSKLTGNLFRKNLQLKDVC